MFGSGFTDVTDLPGGEASTAYSLLDGAGDGSSAKLQAGKIVWHTDGTSVTAPKVRSEVTGWLATVEQTPGVESVTSPYTSTGATQVAPAAHTAYATVQVTDAADTAAIRDTVESAAAHSAIPLDVALGGQAFTEQPAAGGATEAIGLLAALVILLLMFRSVWAAALPILTGAVGVGVSLLVVMLGSHLVDLSSTSITMAALIGLGVGIDYALFIVNRYRKALMAGESVDAAVLQGVNTSGRAVIFAGLTVAAALLAIVVVGLGILTGMAQAAAVTVLVTVLAAITLLPALLRMLGHRVLSRRQRVTLGTPRAHEKVTTHGEHEHGAGRGVDDTRGLAVRWADLVLRFPRRVALLALAVMVVLALPVLSMRVGNADASSDPAGSAGREYSQLMAPAFGKGADASLLLVAQVPDTDAQVAFSGLLSHVGDLADVASVASAPAQPGQTVAVATVTPTSSAQTAATQELVHTLRDDAVPAAEQGSSLRIYVGGETASNIDVADALMSKLPLYLGLVALLGFALLAIAFRSILVPLIGAISNLATILVSLGVMTAIFQFGWGSQLLGVGTGAPITYIVPVLIVGIMFGLSMDYQVFLVSRMHEEWNHTRDNDRSVRVGLVETAKVIVTAALIMLAVFSSFGFSGERIIATIGIGLAAGVLVDAFIVRMALMPALFRLIGPRTWAYPAWADRITPRVSVEGPSSGHPTGSAPAALAPEGEAEPLPAGRSAS